VDSGMFGISSNHNPKLKMTIFAPIFLNMNLTVEQYINQNKSRFLDELLSLLRLPSVSADPNYKDDVAKTAELVADYLKKAGALKVVVHPTAGHPIVTGELILSEELPTILVYGHYDVQPADPLICGKSSPFEPEIRDGNIYARERAMIKDNFLCISKHLKPCMQRTTFPAISNL
jgi:hypothetical protein